MKKDKWISFKKALPKKNRLLRIRTSSGETMFAEVDWLKYSFDDNEMVVRNHLDVFVDNYEYWQYSTIQDLYKELGIVL